MIKIKNLLISTVLLNKIDVSSMHMPYDFCPKYNIPKEEKKNTKNSGMNEQKNSNYDKKGVELKPTNLSKQTQ
jgi:hypothetical protein